MRHAYILHMRRKLSVLVFDRRVLTGDANTRVRDRLKAELEKPVNVKLVDKVSFTLGVCGLISTEYVVLKVC